MGEMTTNSIYSSSPKPEMDDNLRRILDEIEIDSPISESVVVDNNSYCQQLNSVKRNLFNTASESSFDNNNEINLLYDLLVKATDNPYIATCVSDIIILPLEKTYENNDSVNVDVKSVDVNIMHRVEIDENRNEDLQEAVPTVNSVDGNIMHRVEIEENRSEGLQEAVPIQNDPSIQVEDKKTKKRKRNVQKWKCNIRKEQREHGKKYTNIKGKVMEQREVKKNTCRPKCTFKCTEKFCEESRNKIHSQFWNLTDSKKSHFFSKYVSKVQPLRKRTKKEVSRNQNVFQYYFGFNFEKHRICKEFFCNTLNISQQGVYYFYKKVQNDITNVPRSPMKGKNTKRVTHPEKLEEVRNHIRSFPAVNSHYCRANSQKEYLEANLNVTKMYDLYRAKHNNPVSQGIYSKVFNTEFNLSFFRPKKDLCDKCEAFKVLVNPSEKQQDLHNEHLQKKDEGRRERNLDREINEDDVAVLTFDLENVFSLPKSEVSNFYYKSKLCVFNLTAYCNKNKTVYCSIWHEFLAGRDSNAIASAVVRILNALAKDLPNVKKVILWSDICVPQNKNSVMSLALMYFLHNTEHNIEVIEQKFSEPGHGNLQEVDAAHSVIERSIRNIGIYSPLGLIRMLMSIRSKKNKLQVLQMKIEDFLNYKSRSSQLKFSGIPYTKIKHIIYNKSLRIRFKNRFPQHEFSEEMLLRQRAPRTVKRKKGGTEPEIPEHGVLQVVVPVLREERNTTARKAKDLKEMIKYMEEGSDKQFYNAVINTIKIKN